MPVGIERMIFGAGLHGMIPFWHTIAITVVGLIEPGMVEIQQTWINLLEEGAIIFGFIDAPGKAG